MSCQREQRVWRVPRSLCGIEGYSEAEWMPFPGRDEGDEWYPLPVLLNWEEFLEEHEEVFGWDAGDFSESLAPGDYIDFILLDRAVHSGWGTQKHEDEVVFRKIVPDLDLDAVHYCEYEWYDGTDAPDMY